VQYPRLQFSGTLCFPRCGVRNAEPKSNEIHLQTVGHTYISDVRYAAFYIDELADWTDPLPLFVGSAKGCVHAKDGRKIMIRASGPRVLV
jgi:hypothetical protein